MREALEIGRDAGLPVHISHFKASGHESWGSVRAAAELISQARQAGERVTADQYPYVASSTSLAATLISAWAREGDHAAFVKRLNDPKLLERIRSEISERLDPNKRIQIATYKAHPEWAGRSLDEIAKAESRDQVDVVLEIERHGGASVVNFGMNEEDVRFVMQLPWVATASDGSARLPDLDRPHPRSFGTFAQGRPLRDRRQSSPAGRCNSQLHRAAGRDPRSGRSRHPPHRTVADLVVFAPETFRDQATFEEPYHYATGVRYVFVAGRPAVYEGTATGSVARAAPCVTESRKTSAKAELARTRAGLGSSRFSSRRQEPSPTPLIARRSSSMTAGRSEPPTIGNRQVIAPVAQMDRAADF